MLGELTIGLDLRPTEPGFKAHAGRGTGRYTAEVSRRLLDATAASAELKFTGVYCDQVVHSGLEARLLEVVPYGRRTLESQFLLPRRLQALGVDLMHFFSHGDAPARCMVPQVVTVLDLIPLRFPELYRAQKSGLRFRFARKLEHEAVRKSLGVLAISEATKKDCIELLGVEPDRVVVTPLGVNPNLLKSVDDGAQAVRLKAKRRLELGLPEQGSLLLYLGGIDPRKNVLFLLEVFAELLSNWREKDTPLKLVLAGAFESDDQYPVLLRRIDQLSIKEHVILYGFVPDEHLGSLYASVDLLLFPSLYEGFGLPALEAMACGLPVVAGNNSSLPEVVGQAGILLPDNDRYVWVKSVYDLLANSGKITELSALGRIRAGEFTWDRTVEKTRAAYHYFWESFGERTIRQHEFYSSTKR